MSTSGAPAYTDKPDGSSRRIGIVAASWHNDIVQILIDGCRDCLLRHGVHENDIVIVRCPGTFEIPLTAAYMADTGEYHAIVTLGVVVQGETPHFGFIAGSAVDALQKVGLDSGVPCVFGVLTVNTIEQAWERAGGVHGHKGAEAAEVALRMAQIIDDLTDASE
ncbi:MAG: 6,7-dimethyl-8-ribityllumazine synthase [bacterium]|nr:6,7-dimethyl-8-ribityllumazine synthase [bacterium]